MMQVSSHLVNKLAYSFEKSPSYIKKELVIFLYSLNTILKKLLVKFQTPNIEKALSNIITRQDFLTGRSFCVCVGGEFSNLKNVLSGIHQGSVLGPLLFVLYINDLPNSIKSFTKLFEDDC